MGYAAQNYGVSSNAFANGTSNYDVKKDVQDQGKKDVQKSNGVPMSTGNTEPVGDNVQFSSPVKSTPVSSDGSPAEEGTKKPALRQLYSGENSYSILTRAAGFSNQAIMNLAQSKSNIVGNDLAKGRPILGGILRNAASRRGTAGGQDVVESFNNLDRASSPEAAKECLDTLEGQLRNNRAQLDRVKPFLARRGTSDAAVVGIQNELSKGIEQLSQLKKIPASVVSEVTNLTQKDFDDMLDDINQAGDSKIKQAAAIINYCPAAVTAMMDEIAAGTVSPQQFNNGKLDANKLREDFKQNGPELLKAIANMPEEEKNKLKNTAVSQIVKALEEKPLNNGQTPKQTENRLEQVLSKENLETFKEVIEKTDSETLAKLMNDAVDVAQMAAVKEAGKKYVEFMQNPAGAISSLLGMMSGSNGLQSLVSAMKAMPKDKRLQVSNELMKSGVLPVLEKASPEAYERFSKFFQL